METLPQSPTGNRAKLTVYRRKYVDMIGGEATDEDDDEIVMRCWGRKKHIKRQQQNHLDELRAQIGRMDKQCTR
jgi:hypothetical protein